MIAFYYLFIYLLVLAALIGLFVYGYKKYKGIKGVLVGSVCTLGLFVILFGDVLFGKIVELHRGRLNLEIYDADAYAAHEQYRKEAKPYFNKKIKIDDVNIVLNDGTKINSIEGSTDSNREYVGFITSSGESFYGSYFVGCIYFIPDKKIIFCDRINNYTQGWFYTLIDIER